MSPRMGGGLLLLGGVEIPTEFLPFLRSSHLVGEMESLLHVDRLDMLLR